MEFFIICENSILPYTLTSFGTSVVTLLAIHYVFNIEYPTATHILCKFLEKFCIELPNLKKLSPTVIGLITSIERQKV